MSTKIVVATREDAQLLHQLLRTAGAKRASIVIAGSRNSTMAVANTLSREHRSIVVVDAGPGVIAAQIRDELDALKRDPMTSIIVVDPSLQTLSSRLNSLRVDQLRDTAPIAEILAEVDRLELVS